jgi:NADH-quinone oxidoreductase subunit E
MNVDSAKEVSLDLRLLDEILTPMSETGPDNLIPVLHEIQEAYGYLPAEVLSELSRRSGIAASRIYGVVTFYEYFHLEPHGRHTVRCCRGTACHVRGGQKIIAATKRILGIEPGQTTDDMQFTFETVACLGTCFLAPAMMVDADYYGHLTAKKIEDILQSYRGDKCRKER